MNAHSEIGAEAPRTYVTGNPSRLVRASTAWVKPVIAGVLVFFLLLLGVVVGGVVWVLIGVVAGGVRVVVGVVSLGVVVRPVLRVRPRRGGMRRSGRRRTRSRRRSRRRNMNTIPTGVTLFLEVINVACSDATRPVKGSGPPHVAIGAGGEKVNGGVPVT
jgi:hypothetical protein